MMKNKKYNNRSQKMYNSIVQGLQNAIDDAHSQNSMTDLDRLTFNDVPLSTEDSLVDIIPIDWDDTGSDNKE